MIKLMLTSFNVLYKNHKHVAAKIESSWGSSRCDEALYQYLVKNSEDRVGFCPSVYKEILNLYVLHSRKYGSKYSMLSESEKLNVHVEQ